MKALSVLGIAVALLVAARSAPVRAQATAPPESAAPLSDRAAGVLYARAVGEMRALAEPAFVTYQAIWTSTGIGFDIYEDGAKIVLAIGTGRDFKNRHDYSTIYRRADRMLAVTADSRDRLLGKGAHFLDPTWSGAYDIVRYGFHGDAAPSPSPVPLTPATTPAIGAELPLPAPRTIGGVTAISAAFYHVEDHGAGVCPSGIPGHVLNLAALSDRQGHPLNQVTIDASTNRFCNMRFNVNQPGAFGLTGDYELHFAQSGEYWLVSGGSCDVAVRFLGISAKHVTLNWENSAVTTPADVADTAFAPNPSPPPRPHER